MMPKYRVALYNAIGDFEDILQESEDLTVILNSCGNFSKNPDYRSYIIQAEEFLGEDMWYQPLPMHYEVAS
jgi:hypothetical protein